MYLIWHFDDHFGFWLHSKWISARIEWILVRVLEYGGEIWNFEFSRSNERTSVFRQHFFWLRDVVLPSTTPIKFTLIGVQQFLIFFFRLKSIFSEKVGAEINFLCNNTSDWGTEFTHNTSLSSKGCVCPTHFTTFASFCPIGLFQLMTITSCSTDWEQIFLFHFQLSIKLSWHAFQNAWSYSGAVRPGGKLYHHLPKTVQIFSHPQQ